MRQLYDVASLRCWRSWLQWGALICMAACTTSFALPSDAGIADGAPNDAPAQDSDACTDPCACMWNGRPPSGEAPSLGSVPEEGVPYNHPEYGTCMRRVGVSGGQWLRQVTPDWIVSQGWSNFVHTERATGVQEELGLGTALHGYVDRTRFRYLRFHVENSREADGLNAFCERVRSGEETCVTFDTSSIWTPSLVDVDVTSIRRRAVAMGSEGLARRWTAIVEGAGGASLATFVSVDEPFHHARLPDELLAQLSAARLFIEPSGEWLVVLAGSTLWRFRQSSTLSFEGAFTLDREPESAVLVEGPSFVYATNGSVWQNDFESPETLVTRAGAAPCGEGSVICDPVAMVLAHAPGARPGWVTLAFHAPSAGERVPWAAGHLALAPLRADAPLYTLTRHLTSVRLNGSGWAFSVAWDANAHELMWRSAWDGTLPADTLFAAKLPPEWWSMDR